MPAITSIDSARLCSLKEKAAMSVVSLLRISKESKEYIDFAIGFLLYVDKPKAVIVTCVEAFDEDDCIYARFHDGTIEEASVFVKNFSSIYTSLLVYTTSPIQAVTFNETAVGRGDLVFTLAKVLTDSVDPGMYTGSIIHPRCVSVDRQTGQPQNRYNNLFALTCPVAGPCPLKKRAHTMLRLIGAPVFDMKADVVGLIERSSEKLYGIKFARLSSSVADELKILFKDSNWKGALVRQLGVVSS